MTDKLLVALAARLSWFAPTYTMDACQIEADAILALCKDELVKAQREAFVGGSKYGAENPSSPVSEDKAEAERRYPDA